MRRQDQMAYRGVQRRKHFRIGEHIGSGEPVEQSRLSGVGIADKPDSGQRHPLALPALHGAAGSYTLKVVLNLAKAPEYLAAIRLELSFTWSPGPNASAQS